MIVVEVLNYLFFAANKTVDDKETETSMFTAYFQESGEEVEDDNRIARKIEELTGVKVQVRCANEDDFTKDIKRMVAYQQYPDFINGGAYTARLVHSNALIPLENYIPKYKHLKNYLTKEERDAITAKDGHIYFIPQHKKIDPQCYNYTVEPCFYIQQAVLKWAGYPKIQTVSEYFDLIERYRKQFPVINGKETIGFLMDCEDWRIQTVFKTPQVIAGYMYNSLGVYENEEFKLFNFLPETYKYYKILNQEYNKGIIDASTFLYSCQEYRDKIEQGCVLGVFDIYNEIDGPQIELSHSGQIERTYVPMELSLDYGKKVFYGESDQLGSWSGVGISRSCQNVEKALQFMDDLLSPEIMKLRFWGEEGVDYSVNEEGIFELSSDQANNRSDESYRKKNYCRYKEFPQYCNLLEDGINAVYPVNQKREYAKHLTKQERELLNAYGVKNYNDFITYHAKLPENQYTMSNFMMDNIDYGEIGKVYREINDMKRRWIPYLIMSETYQFDEIWSTYQTEFSSEYGENELNMKLKNKVSLRNGNEKR